MIEHGLPYVLSALTVAQMWLAGSVNRWTWVVVRNFLKWRNTK